jgi:glycosyltransferase involved in cell wall biosynthesis
MATFHILTQYVWPDAAPTGLYAEHLATRLHQNGCNVRLVGGNGNYRMLERERPPVPILHLDHYRGRRGNLAQVFREYASVKRSFENYIDNFVGHSDVIVATSAPPNTVQLANRIKRRGAHAIYWLQDYYPELIRGIREYPAPLRRVFSRFWDHQLAQWDRVVKIGENLGGPLTNSVVIRNWPTISFDEDPKPESKTALYLGNLGYGHDIDLFVKGCERLRDDGYKINIRADGRGVRHLPPWLKAESLCRDVNESRDVLLRHEVHLIAAHPKITQAIFPSKIWNSIALGRRLVCTGFAGEMATELDATKRAPFDTHLQQWVDLISSMAVSPLTESAVKSRESISDLRPAAMA